MEEESEEGGAVVVDVATGTGERRALNYETTVNCAICGEQFERRNPCAKYCSDECVKASATQRKPKLHSLTCKVCGCRFEGTVHRLRCDLCKGRKARGCYVYAWIDGGQLFYIGMGHGSRAFDMHHKSGKIYPCEVRRRLAGDRFKVAIIRDNLTTDGASLVEATLINFLRPECNRLVGHSKAVKGLLSLDGMSFDGGFIQSFSKNAAID